MLYNHNLIEKKWQKFWQENNTYKFVDSNLKPKFYGLDMFPYPSGSGMHVGHLKGYLATEILCRLKKMQGYDILHPIGWDAFGLPAEQYALQTKNSPWIFTQQNINNFRAQLKRIGFSFDFSKEVDTTDPAYYQWTQWIFVQLYKNELAEIQEINVNWCEHLRTVLSNEEVIIKNGKRVSERGEHEVTYRPMKQWVLKITKYADKLLDGLNDLNWPEGIKQQQRLWIGRKEKYRWKFNSEFGDFYVDLDEVQDILLLNKIQINLQHPLSQKIIINSHKDLINDFLNKSTQNELDLNITWKNLITQQNIPIFLSKVLDHLNPELVPILSNAEFVDNEELILDILKKQEFEKVTTYKLRDWIFSRQRYWGEPIPIYFDEENNTHIENQLPLILPILDEVRPSTNGISPLENAFDWIKFQKNNKNYRREINTMPNWAGSCWYYAGYLLKNSDQSYTPLNSSEAFARFKRWLPVNVYIGGQEHAVLHLLYARFWHRFLYDLNIFPTPEPFQTLINQGMILGSDNQKMSKSKGNVINPDEIVESHGADALRLYECFMGPINASLSWNKAGLDGMRKWVDRVYHVLTNLNNLTKMDDTDYEFRHLTAKLLNQMNTSIEKMSFNITISELMIGINTIVKTKKYSQKYVRTFIQILSFYAPHLAEELWSIVFCEKQSIYFSKYPDYNKNDLKKDTYDLPITINNKLKLVLPVSYNLNSCEVENLVLNNEKIYNLLKNQTVKKVVLIKEKIINIIVDTKKEN